MNFVNFYPGPSAIYPNVRKYCNEALKSGILEQNHRSNVFMDMLKHTIQTTKTKLNIPENYQIFFTSSATECWEIVTQSCLNQNTEFIYNGAFGNKWASYAKNILPKDYFTEKSFDINQSIFSIDLNNGDKCVVANETSNGTQLSNLEIAKLKTTDNLVCVDATSNMAGVNLDFSKADIWLASSQKCFGLPSGLGIMVVSPFAMQRAREIDDRKHYNSLLFIEENFRKFQTPYTPNILEILLFGKVMDEVENIEIISQKIKKRAKEIYDNLVEFEFLNLLISNEKVRSDTVIAVKTKHLAKIKNKMESNGILIGNGYGDWKNETFRIANFPAIPDAHYEIFFNTLRRF